MRLIGSTLPEAARRRNPALFLASVLCVAVGALLLTGTFVLITRPPPCGLLAPGAVTFSASAHAEGSVFHEYRTRIDGRDVEVPPFDGLACDVDATDGRGGVELVDGRDIGHMYTWIGRQGRMRYVIRATRTTEARLTCRYEPGRTAVTVQEGANGGLLLMIVTLPLSFVLLLAGVVLLYVALLKPPDPPRRVMAGR